MSWELPNGLTAVLGQNGAGEGISSNGAGKTKMLETIPISLFGPKLSWSEYATLGVVGETTMVELEFEHRGEVYRVRRTYNPAGRGKTTLDFERMARQGPAGRVSSWQGTARLGNSESDPPEWESLTLENQKATQDMIELLLGMSEETFAQSVFSRQGEIHFASPEITPAQRKQILGQALGLDLWAKLTGIVQPERMALESDIMVAESKRDQYATAEQVVEAETALALDRVAAAELEQQITALELALEEQRRSLNAASEAAAARREAEARRDAAKSEFARMHELSEQAQEAGAEADKILPQIEEEARLAATVPELEQQLAASQETSAAVKQRGDMLTQAKDLSGQSKGFLARAQETQAKIGETEGALRSTCDRCGQTVEAEARETMLNSLRGDLLILETEAARLIDESSAVVLQADTIVIPEQTEDVDTLNALLRVARESEATLARLEARYEAFGAVLARVTEESFTEAYAAARDALVKAEQAIRDMPDAAELLTAAPFDGEAQLRLKRDQHTLLVSSRGAGEERVRALQESLAEGSGHQQRVNDLHARLTDLKYMERMYGRDGIPALLLEALAVPQIEAEAQRVLQALGTDLRVELRTQRALKTDDRQKETLDVVVCEPNGERSYASFSGGEKSRVNLALRIGLARLIAGRKGADVKILALDEVEYLDSAGLRLLPEVLRGLTEFDKVICVHHNEALLDGFDSFVTVIKDGDRSRIES